MATQITMANSLTLHHVRHVYIMNLPTLHDEIHSCKVKYINRNYKVEFTNKLARKLSEYSHGIGSSGKSPLYKIISQIMDEY